MRDKSARVGVCLKRYTHLFCFSIVLSCVPGALAQMLTVSPSSVSFSYVSKSGNIPPNQTVMVTSSAGATAIGISADPAQGNSPPPQFAAVVPPSGTGAGATTPVPLTIKIAPAMVIDPLAPGKYTRTFSIYGPAGFNTPMITVTLTVTEAEPPPSQTIAASPTSASLVAPVCPAPAPASQPGPMPESNQATGTPSTTPTCYHPKRKFKVSSLNGAAHVSHMATASPSYGLVLPPDLDVPASGDAELTVEWDPLGVPQGSYRTSVIISPDTGAPVTVFLNLISTNETILTEIPDSADGLTFNVPSSGPQPAPQAIKVSEFGGPFVPFTTKVLNSSTAACLNSLNNPIITASDNDTIVVRLNQSVTFVAPCLAVIEINAPGAENPVLTYPVFINVPKQASLDYLTTTEADLKANGIRAIHSSTVLPTTVTVFDAAAGAGIPLSVQSTSPGVTAQLLDPATPARLAISVAAGANQPPGTYTATVVVTSPQADKPLTITGEWTVSGPPSLSAFPSSLFFTEPLNVETADTKSVSLSGTPNTYNVSVFPPNVFSTARTVTILGTGATTLNVTATPGATPGTTTGIIFLNQTGASNPTITFPVTVTTDSDTDPLVHFFDFHQSPRSFSDFHFDSPGKPVNNVNVSVNTADGSNCATLITPSTINILGGGTPTAGVLKFSGPCLGNLNLTDATGKPLNTTVFTRSSDVGGQFHVSGVSLYAASGIFAGGHLVGPAELSKAPSVLSETINLTSPDGSSQPYVAIAPDWLTVTPAGGTTPTTITVAGNSSVLSTLSPGSYVGTVTIMVSGDSNPQVIPVNLLIGTTAAVAIVNAASGKPDPVSPGEIVSIFGTNIGPTAAAGLTLTSGGTVSTTLGNTQVLFDGVPAPLTYAGSGQINAIVPYETAGRQFTNVAVQNNGTTVGQTLLDVADSDPAIFSLAGGSGQGAILNQDGAVNGASNPAAAGSVIVIYATGEGMLTPAATTGSVTSSTGPTFPAPVLPVLVTIAGQQASVGYAGEAPGFASGVFQLDVTIPPGVKSGAQPVVVTVGDSSNAAQNVTVAVQ